MKFFSVIIFLLSLASCSIVPVEKIEISSASLNNVKVETVGIIDNQQYMKISADYHIENYITQKNLYYCKIHIAGRKGSVAPGSASKCKIENSEGYISVEWVMPTVKAEFISNGVWGPQDLYYPIKYFLAVHQNLGQGNSRIIAKTDVYTTN